MNIQELQAEAYQLYFEDKIKSSKALLEFGGIICQLDGDVLSYRLKNGLNYKLKDIIDRNEKLRDIYDHFYSISEQLEQMKMIIRKNNARMLQLEEENEKLIKLLQNYQTWE